MLPFGRLKAPADSLSALARYYLAPFLSYDGWSTFCRGRTVMRVAATLVGLGLCASVAGCGGSPNSVSPTRIPGTPVTASQGSTAQSTGGESRISTQRVSEGGGGGGSQCTDEDALKCGELRVDAGDADMFGFTTIVRTTNPLAFSASSDRLANLAGHFSDGTIQLRVENDSATISLILVAQSNGASFVISGVGRTTQSIGSCGVDVAPLTTKVTLQLQYLGQTTITETHRIACVPS
jgi:hypothetical protein